MHGNKAMKSYDLIQKYLGLMSDKNFNEKTLKILANLADLDKNGFITYDEFKRFEELLCSPDVLFKCAFQLFDTKGTGLINFGLFSFLFSYFIFFSIICII